jgi:hypothetical protein
VVLRHLVIIRSVTDLSALSCLFAVGMTADENTVYEFDETPKASLRTRNTTSLTTSPGWSC